MGQKSKYRGVGDVPHPHLIYKIKSDKKTMSWREKILLKTIRIRKDEEVTENYEHFMKRKHIVEDHNNKITLQRRKNSKNGRQIMVKDEEYW